MKSKKVISVFVLVFSIFVLFTENVNSESQAGPFKDVSYENESYSAILDLKDSGIVQGYQDGSFKPDVSINRAEFTKILVMASGAVISGSQCFTDVTDQWFAPYVCKAKELGYVNGYDDGFFRPEQNINFAEASKIISNSFGLIKEDIDEDLWFKNYVLALQDYAAIPSSVLHFDQSVTRAEMSEMIYRVKNGYTQKAYNTFESISKGEVANNDTVSVQNFRSCEHIAAYMSQPNFSNNYYNSGWVDDNIDFEMAEEPSAVPSEGVKMESNVEQDEYSSTNVQVQGVDEADIVKNDGEYIYVLKGNTVRIVEAKPAETMKEISFVEFPIEEFYPRDMYVSGDRLVVLGNYYGTIPVPYSENSSIMPRYSSEELSKVYVYDISDKEKVVLYRDFEIEGSTVSTRKIGDMLYLVANKYEYYYYPYNVSDSFQMPMYKDSEMKEESSYVAECSDVSYFPGLRDGKRFMMVFGIPVDDKSKEVVSQIVVASGNDVYASTKNLYVAESRYDGSYRIMGDIYSSEEKTVIYKFGLSSEGIDYKGNGVVPGTILNQFSMDEFGNDFRIATTTNNWSSLSKNNVYVLDSSLKVAGKLEGLAEGERIYSVRFMGGRAYLVTFRETDPFFVIDLMDAKNPKVLGELKIPGYSDYLHPYDENHIIGFGKDTKVGDTWGSPWYQGMKLAIFDVSDVENPVEMFKEVIGDRGTDSELLNNHKALLFDKSKGILAFPISVAELSADQKNDASRSEWTYGDTVFQGAYFYNISLDKGFEFKGKVSHLTDAEMVDLKGSYWYGDNMVERVLYIGDVFYTVSKDMIKANKMSNLADVSTAKLGGDNSYWDFY